MELIKLKEEERRAIKDKTLNALKKVELNVYLDKGKPDIAIPLLRDYHKMIGNILESFDKGNKEKVLQYFSRQDISGLITDESYFELEDKEYKDKVPPQFASKTGFISAGILAELLPLSKLEVIAENILDAIVNMREYTAFLLLRNINIPSNSVKINETFSLVRVAEDMMTDYKLPQEWEEFKWEKGKIYLSVKQQGFVGGLVATLTIHSILSKLKTFLGLALIQGILKTDETSYGYFSNSRQATPINLGIFQTSPQNAYFFPFVRPHKLSESFTNLVKELSLTKESTMPSHDLQRLESPQEYLEDKFKGGLKGVLEADDDFAGRIKTASEWYFESLCTDNETYKIIQMTVAIEALLGEGKEQVTERLADRCSFLLGENQRERVDIKDDFSTIYSIRSNTIHKGRIMLSDEEHPYLKKLKQILENAIRKEIGYHSNIPKGK
jgi:hypothetical protein